MVDIKEFHGVLPEKENKMINRLHNRIFNTDDNLNDKIAEKNKVLTITASTGSEIVGYKIGYEKDESTFYSWLGGVKQEYRNAGIAQKLMDKQVDVLTNKGYNTLQTKTFNKWKGMLILNIKNYL